MSDKKCIIFAAGDFDGTFEKCDGDLIIAADAGYRHLEKMGINPDILLGDFDTIGDMPKHENIIPFPPEKDLTDTELAMIEGIKHGYKDFLICGAVGGKRLEHTLGNLSLAASYAQKGYGVVLTDGDYVVKAVTDSSVSFDENEKGFISLFTISGKAEGVSISGLKYPLSDATLDSSNPTLCISNEFLSVWPYIFKSTMHCWYSITLSCRSITNTPFSAKLFTSKSCCTSTVFPLYITTENEYLTIRESLDSIRGESFVINLHNNIGFCIDNNLISYLPFLLCVPQ